MKVYVMRILTTLFKHFNLLDLESSEQSKGTSLSNNEEAQLVLYLYQCLFKATNGGIKNKIAIISPYMQQVLLIRRLFEQQYGLSYKKVVTINTIDSFQGKESDIVIMSSVRAAAKTKGIGFLSDLRRLNVALTRAKFYLFIVARCDTVMQNPYWNMLVNHAFKTKSMFRVHPSLKTRGGASYSFKSIVNRL
jgi:senataxin